MNVLLIAPEIGLPAVTDEVRAVSLSLRPVIVNGTVSRKDVLHAIQSHDWDVIWFATHGGPMGIELSDEQITVSDLTAVVRASGAWLVVLNTCSSRLIGLELHYELGVSVITTVAEIDDKSAYQTGVLLAMALAEHGDPLTAFNASKPGQGHNYIFFHANRHDESTETKTILMLNEWGARLSSKVDRLERRFDQELTELRQQISVISGNIETAVRLSPWHQFAFVMAFILLFLPIPLFYVQVREWLNVGWQAALTVAFLAYLLSAIFWSYMWWGGRR